MHYLINFFDFIMIIKKNIILIPLILSLIKEFLFVIIFLIKFLNTERMKLSIKLFNNNFYNLNSNFLIANITKNFDKVRSLILSIFEII